MFSICTARKEILCDLWKNGKPQWKLPSSISKILNPKPLVNEEKRLSSILKFLNSKPLVTRQKGYFAVQNTPRKQGKKNSDRHSLGGGAGPIFTQWFLMYHTFFLMPCINSHLLYMEFQDCVIFLMGKLCSCRSF